MYSLITHSFIHSANTSPPPVARPRAGETASRALRCTHPRINVFIEQLLRTGYYFGAKWSAKSPAHIPLGDSEMSNVDMETSAQQEGNKGA